MSRRSRRAALKAVSNRGLPFNDAVDAVRGETVLFGSLPEVPPVLSTVHRIELEPEVVEILSRGRGPSVVGARPRGIRFTPRVYKYPPHAKRSFWNSFNALQLDKRTKVCVDRKVRKQVLFARKVAGRRGIKSYKRTYYSQWRC